MTPGALGTNTPTAPNLIAHPAASPFLQKPRHLTLTVSAAPINLTTPNALIASQAMF